MKEEKLFKNSPKHMQCLGQDPSETGPLKLQKLSRLVRWRLRTWILSGCWNFMNPLDTLTERNRARRGSQVQHEKHHRVVI